MSTVLCNAGTGTSKGPVARGRGDLIRSNFADPDSFFTDPDPGILCNPDPDLGKKLGRNFSFQPQKQVVNFGLQPKKLITMVF